MWVAIIWLLWQTWICYKSCGLLSSGSSGNNEYNINHVGCYHLDALESLNMLLIMWVAVILLLWKACIWHKSCGLLSSGYSGKPEYGMNHVGCYHLVAWKAWIWYKSCGLLSSGCSGKPEYGINHMGCYHLVALESLNMAWIIWVAIIWLLWEAWICYKSYELLSSGCSEKPEYVINHMGC